MPLCPNRQQRQHAPYLPIPTSPLLPIVAAEPDYLMDPFTAFLDCVDHREAFQTPRLHGVLAIVRCKSDGAGILDKTRLSSYSMSTKFRRIFFNGEELRVIVELQGFSAELPRYAIRSPHPSQNPGLQ